MVIELMQESLNSSMGEHLVANNKLAYSAHQTPPITPDGIPSGAPAVREALSDSELRGLRGSIFSRVIRAFRRAEPVPKNSISAISAFSAVRTIGVENFEGA